MAACPYLLTVRRQGRQAYLQPGKGTILVASSSPENSRTMKEKSHRAKRRCYRSGVWTLRGTHTRRLDGHSLYNARRAQGPRDFQADHRSVRSAPSQLRWRRDSEIAEKVMRETFNDR